MCPTLSGRDFEFGPIWSRFKTGLGTSINTNLGCEALHRKRRQAGCLFRGAGMPGIRGTSYRGGTDSCYSDLEQMDFGLMFHSFVYPDQNGTNQLEALFGIVKLERGVIRYCKQEDCVQRISSGGR